MKKKQKSFTSFCNIQHLTLNRFAYTRYGNSVDLFLLFLLFGLFCFSCVLFLLTEHSFNSSSVATSPYQWSHLLCHNSWPLIPGLTQSLFSDSWQLLLRNTEVKGPQIKNTTTDKERRFLVCIVWFKNPIKPRNTVITATNNQGIFPLLLSELQLNVWLPSPPSSLSVSLSLPPSLPPSISLSPSHTPTHTHMHTRGHARTSAKNDLSKPKNVPQLSRLLFTSKPRMSQNLIFCSQKQKRAF